MRTNGHDEINSSFSLFCEGAQQDGLMPSDKKISKQYTENGSNTSRY
jgi:hypothetical protein